MLAPTRITEHNLTLTDHILTNRLVQQTARIKSNRARRTSSRA